MDFSGTAFFSRGGREGIVCSMRLVLVQTNYDFGEAFCYIFVLIPNRSRIEPVGFQSVEAGVVSASGNSARTQVSGPLEACLLLSPSSFREPWNLAS